MLRPRPCECQLRAAKLRGPWTALTSIRACKLLEPGPKDNETRDSFAPIRLPAAAAERVAPAAADEWRQTNSRNFLLRSCRTRPPSPFAGVAPDPRRRCYFRAGAQAAPPQRTGAVLPRRPCAPERTVDALAARGYCRAR